MSHSVSVAAVTVGDAGRILVVKRRDNERWQLPGGVLEPHEPVEHGLVREVLEETGVSVEPLRLSGIYKHVGLGIVSLVFRCAAVGTFVRLLPESVRVGWMTLDEVDEEMDRVFCLRVHDAVISNGDGVNRLPIRHHDGREFLNSQQTLPIADDRVKPTASAPGKQRPSLTPELRFGLDGVVDRVTVSDDAERPVGDEWRNGRASVGRSIPTGGPVVVPQPLAGPIETVPTGSYSATSTVPLFPYMRERR